MDVVTLVFMVGCLWLVGVLVRVGQQVVTRLDRLERNVAQLRDNVWAPEEYTPEEWNPEGEE